MSILLELNRFFIPVVPSSSLIVPADYVPILNSAASDALLAQRKGIDDTNGAHVLPSISNIDALIPASTDVETQVENGIKMFLAPFLRYIAPFTASTVSTLSTSFNTGSQNIVSTSLSSSLEVTRLAIVSFSFIIWTDVAPFSFSYNVNINGIGATTPMTFTLDQAFSHQCISGQWAVSIPTDQVVINGVVTAGANIGGSLIFDKTASLAVLG